MTIEGKMRYSRSFSPRGIEKFAYVSWISVSIMVVVIGLLLLGGFGMGMLPASTLPASLLALFLGSVFLILGWLEGSYVFYRTTFGITDKGLLMPYPTKRTLHRDRHRMLSFEDIEAIYTNEYWASNRGSPAVVVLTRTGRIHSIDDQALGRLSALLENIPDTVKVYRDRDLISGIEIFPPSTSIQFLEDSLILKTGSHEIVIELEEILKVRGGTFPHMKLRNGKKIGFHSAPLLLLRKIRNKIRGKHRQRSANLRD